jgi:hypothetical protein
MEENVIVVEEQELQSKIISVLESFVILTADIDAKIKYFL